MRSLLRRIWWVLTFPFRIVTWPYRKFREFIEYEPEDVPAGDVFSHAMENPATLIEHLEALRTHLLRSLVVLAITTALSFAFSSTFLDWLAQPIGGIEALQAIEVTESVGAFMRVSLMSGFALAFPYISFEIFAFVNPGLKRNERVLIITALPFAFILFLAGLAFAYFIMLPAALPFLTNFMGITTRVRPSNYIRFVSGLMFWIGMAFQFPLVVFILSRIGLIKARSLARGWRFAILGIAVLAAMVTPTIDPVNMALVMAPMIVLYFISILLAALGNRGAS